MRLRRFRHIRTVVEIAGAVVLLSSGVAFASAVRPASTPSGLTGARIHGCANTRTGAVSIVLTAGKHCPRSTTAVYWNADLLGSKTNMAATGTSGTQCTLGQIILTAGRTAMSGTVPANGQVLQIQQNTALFSLLEFQYGGNGKTTFALPNLKGTAPNGLTYSICVTGVFP